MKRNGMFSLEKRSPGGHREESRVHFIIPEGKKQNNEVTERQKGKKKQT